MTTTIDETALREKYEAAGQGHVFDHIDDEEDGGLLSADEKAAFLQQLNDIPVESIATLLEAAKQDHGSSGGGGETITPFSQHVGRTTDENANSMEMAHQKGIAAIAQGQVAALVLAGGQGTRLGFDGPKGCYDIGLPSGRTLFQLLAERLIRLKQIASAGSTIPFYIMTSPINHEVTVQYFKDQNYFGLPPEDVLFFEQGMLPCLTKEGKIILEGAGKVAMAPDGYV